MHVTVARENGLRAVFPKGVHHRLGETANGRTRKQVRLPLGKEEAALILTPPPAPEAAFFISRKEWRTQ
jgi:hypothetical protein